MTFLVDKIVAAAARSAVMEAENHLKNSAMEAVNHVKHGRSSVSQKNRGYILQRIFLFFAIFGVCVASADAQDVISLKNGMDVRTVIQEIGEEEVAFKMYDNSDGSEFTLRKWEIAKIKFANGSEEVFNVEDECTFRRPSNFLWSETNKGRTNCLLIFENRMNICGFTKRVVPFDFFSERHQRRNQRAVNLYAAGIWINYAEGLVAIRTDMYVFKEIIVPIESIRSLEVLEDGRVKTTAVGGSFWAVANTKETISEVKIRVVVGVANRGTQAHFLTLHDVLRLNKSDFRYGAVLECMRTIFDEIEFLQSEQ